MLWVDHSGAITGKLGHVVALEAASPPCTCAACFGPRMTRAANRTDDSFRSRQSRLDRIMAARQSVYGARHRDADVRLLALRRELAAEGRRRRRGRFAADDALPRRSTWHKLAAGMQRTIRGYTHRRVAGIELLRLWGAGG